MIKLIVAVDSNYGIGYENELLFRVSEDMKHFKNLTTGHFVVMGRKTYESLPKALPERVNVVVTRNPNFKPNEPTVVVESEIERIVSHYLGTGQQEKDLWVIGGAEIYNQFLPYADEIHLTKIHKEAEHVDTFFPIEEVKRSFQSTLIKWVHSEKEDCMLTHITYERKQS